jgi:hypothetical protein
VLTVRVCSECTNRQQLQQPKSDDFVNTGHHVMHHHSSAEKVSSLRSRPSQISSPALDCRKRRLLRLLLVLLLLVLLLRRPSRVLLLQAAIHIIRPAG